MDYSEDCRDKRVLYCIYIFLVVFLVCPISWTAEPPDILGVWEAKVWRTQIFEFIENYMNISRVYTIKA